MEQNLEKIFLEKDSGDVLERNMELNQAQDSQK